MKLLNLNKKLERIDKDSIKKKHSWKRFFIGVFVFFLILFVGLYLPLRGVYLSSRRVVASGRALATAIKTENFDQIKLQTKEVKSAVTDLNGSLNWMIWMTVIPFVGGYYQDARHFSKAGVYELAAAEQVIEMLEPHKDELGFSGQTAQGADKLSKVVKILDKIIPNLDKIEPDLKRAAVEVESVDVSKYPENFRQYRVKSLVDTAKNLITGAAFTLKDHKDALAIAPEALGEPTAKNYLIIFQNDKELRPTGGFMTAYAFLKLDKGRITSSTSDDIYRLDEKLLNVCLSKVCPLTPPAPIVKYLPEFDGKPRKTWSMRDSNISPDVPTSLKEFERMYQLLGEGLDFDGIILIDTHVVEEMIKITGPIEVYGTRYSADNDDRCNCPNVIYELENYAQIIEKGEQDRKAILGVLMQQLLAKSLGSATEKLPEFINAGVKLANSKHIIFYMHDMKMQDSLSNLNWIGEMKEVKGDYLHVNDSNFAGGKSNLYVKYDAKLDINIDNSGKVKNSLTLEYSNPQKYDRWLNNRNRDYVRIYVPMGSKLINSKGSDVKVTTIEEENGKTVFEAFIEIRPQNSRTLSFEYELPNSFDGSEYPILIQKQGGSKPFNYDIRINGKSKERFELSTDRELKIKI